MHDQAAAGQLVSVHFCSSAGQFDPARTHVRPGRSGCGRAFSGVLLPVCAIGDLPPIAD
jgi:hypothetical protein